VILTIILSIVGIILMLICILKFPSIKIKNKEIDTFYMPILIVALIFLIFPIFDKTNLFNILFSNSKLNPLKILVLFISISFISITLDEAGFFSYIAVKFINRFKASQYALFFSLYLLISILTIFTSNDIVILTFTPFILYFAKRGNINPIPFLVMEFVAANTYSMLLPIGNPTNIYLSSIYNLDFITYISKMILPTIFVGIASVLVLLLLFHKELSKKIEVFDDKPIHLKNKFICIVSLIHLSLTTILLVISNYISIEMWIIALSFGVSLLIFISVYGIVKKNHLFISRPIKRLPYTLIPFVLSMFIIIMALESFGIFGNIHDLFENIQNDNLKEIVYLISSTISCNLVNNIPMTIAYGSILSGATNETLIYASIIGSNLGALLTPVGALAGIMWMRILKQNDVDYGFIKFMKNGSIITLALLIASGLALLII
jgi:arsenical pump membrane protein